MKQHCPTTFACLWRVSQFGCHGDWTHGVGWCHRNGNPQNKHSILFLASIFCFWAVNVACFCLYIFFMVFFCLLQLCLSAMFCRITSLNKSDWLPALNSLLKSALKWNLASCQKFWVFSWKLLVWQIMKNTCHSYRKYSDTLVLLKLNCQSSD